MNIVEMHAWFRQYAQQMGLQNVRAILPEQIDSLINTSTYDIIDEVINRNVGTTNDRIITDNAKLANINALRTLYKVYSFDPGSASIASYANGNSLSIIESEMPADVLYYVDFSIRYNLDNISTSRLFPIRLIDDTYLADVLNDYVLAPRMRSPVMVIYKQTLNSEDVLCFDLYFGDNNIGGMDSIASKSSVDSIRVSYIKKPAKVQYVSDMGGNNVNSDLPDQLQIPMLKHAVDLYRVSIQGSLYANQQNAQQNQQELSRNNARPTNEGYQS